MINFVYEITKTFSLTKTDRPAVMRFRQKNEFAMGYPAEFYGRLEDNMMLRTSPLTFSHQLGADLWEIKTKNGSVYRIKLVKV